MAKRRLESNSVSGSHRIRIKNNKHESPEWTVIGHLPEEFGFSVGSEIGTPFSGFASDGNVAKLLYLTTDSSAKAGLITKKLFMGPEQSEISFDINFQAYYSGYHEVIDPIVRLMMFSTGHKKSVSETIAEIAGKFRTLDQIGESLTEASGGEIKEKPTFAFMQGPGTCTIKFGKVMKLTGVYISNVTPNFSGILDNEGYPLSGSASITGQLQEPMTKERLATAFQKEQKRIFLSESQREYERAVGDFGLGDEFEDDDGAFDTLG